MTTEFSSGSDWEQSSGPLIERNALEADCWPNSNDVAGKDDLAPGLHPIQAIGPKADRPELVCGVLVSYNATLDRGVLNIAPGFISRHYIANVLTYNAGTPNTWSGTLTAGQVVYVDDSDDLAAGVTLSLSPLNDAGAANPIAGVVWRCQDEEPDADIGGANTDPYPRSFTGNDATYYLEACVMLWPAAS